MRRGFKRLRIPLVILLLLGGAFWYCFIARAHWHVEKDGWLLDFSYIRMRCPTCTGDICRFEYAGHAISCPKYKSEDYRRMTLVTPVGMFEAIDELDGWRFLAFDSRIKDSDVILSDEDRARGYYEISAERPNWDNGWARRRGTPAHWCLGLGASESRWFDPGIMDQLGW
jgi:hypothetical protein